MTLRWQECGVPVVVSVLRYVPSKTHNEAKVVKRDMEDRAYLTHGSAWYPLFSTIFRYRTWIPDTVKYGISNLTVIGARFSFSSAGRGAPVNELQKGA